MVEEKGVVVVVVVMSEGTGDVDSGSLALRVVEHLTCTTHVSLARVTGTCHWHVPPHLLVAGARAAAHM